MSNIHKDQTQLSEDSVFRTTTKTDLKKKKAMLMNVTSDISICRKTSSTPLVL